MSTTTATGMPLGLGRGLTSEPVLSDSDQRSAWIALVATVAVLIGVYWNMLTLTKDFWDDPTYSHGWIIPFFALFLMWSQRKPLGGPISRDQENQNFLQIGVPLAAAVGCYFLGYYGLGWLAYAIAVIVALAIVFRFHQFSPIHATERWIGVGLIVASLLVRIYAASRDMHPVDRLSFLGALFGAFLLAGGFGVVKRMWASIAFFVFMFPLPSVVEQPLLLFLQKLAASASTTVLQVLGTMATRQGNKMIVEGIELEVAQACSGLRMLTIFGAMVIALVLLIERPWWDKLILLLSALPIALMTNIIRITVTALLFLAVRGTSWEEPLHEQIHDVAGYAMIFIAGGIMWMEYKVLSWVFVEERDDAAHAVGIMGRGATTPR